MSAYVICGRCSVVIESYDDDEPYREILELCRDCDADDYAAPEVPLPTYDRDDLR